MAGGMNHVDVQASHPEPVAISDRVVVEAQRFGLGMDVGRPGHPNQHEATAHVVVVEVGLGDVADANAGVLHRRQNPVEIALRVDHQRVGAVVDDVAAIPERRGLDDDHLHGLASSGWMRGSVRAIPRDQGLSGAAP